MIRPFLAALAAALLLGFACGPAAAREPAPAVVQGQTSDAVLANAYAKRISNLWVSGRGTVSKLLKDDSKGSRHQRFLLRLDSGQTLLVAHNIDLAPRIESLRMGDGVEFHGEYEWNKKGGVIHWTHHDPQGRRPGGWLRHKGRLFQ